MNSILRGKPVDWDDVEQLFRSFQSTVFRLETRQRYRSQSEAEPFHQFLAGEIPNSAILDDWQAEINDGMRHGRTYSRVHIVAEPLSDYMRFECAWAYRRNAAAGEDIRILAVDEGDWPDDLPRLDFWLFDSRRLLVLDYTDDGSLLATELIDDVGLATAAESWRDRALRLAIPYTEYEARFDAQMLPR